MKQLNYISVLQSMFLNIYDIIFFLLLNIVLIHSIPFSISLGIIFFLNLLFTRIQCRIYTPRTYNPNARGQMPVGRSHTSDNTN